MEFTDVLALRQSSRAYAAQQLTDAEVDALLRAAQSAPTAGARFERMHLTVVQDPAVLEELNSLFQKATGNEDAWPTHHAPTLIVVSASKEDEATLAGANVGCIMENMLLAATDLGLASLYLFGIFRALQGEARVPELLKLPEGFRAVSAIAVGHPAQPLQARDIPMDRIATDRI